MTPLPYQLTPERPTRLGLVVLQADETIELDFRRLIPPPVECLVSRIPSGAELTRHSIAAMQGHLTAAASLFPAGAAFDAIGYACTSASAQIGAAQVARLIRAGASARHVTDPVTALIAACRALGPKRLALLSPYVAPVSARLRAVLEAAGIATPAFASFGEAQEARVARISSGSVQAACASLLAEAPAVDGIFLSCTNLRTLDILPELEARTGLPVLSSNQVLAWHLLGLVSPPPAGIALPWHAPLPGALAAVAPAPLPQ